MPVLFALALALSGCSAEEEPPADARDPQDTRDITDPTEKAADDLHREIIALTQAGAAKAKANTLTTQFGTMSAAARARKLVADLEVVGTPIPTRWEPTVEWYQGSGALDLNQGSHLIIFWEVWDGRCRQAVVALSATQARFQDAGLSVVGFTRITRSSTPGKLRRFLEENAVSYPIAKGNGEIFSAFRVSTIPTVAVVKDGQLVWRGSPKALGGEMLRALIGG